MQTSFVSSKRFFDQKHFPHGFARSGDFTRSEANLLEAHGQSLQALASGLLSPATAEEHQFLETCQGTRQPASALEKVWAKYQRILDNRKRVLTLCDDWASLRNAKARYDEPDDSSED
ncbi:DUF413 domain-containing protein [Gallaecimonas xiamenensis]|uniref:Macrodomain Ori protein n=1 Tax=Gallaecimonas xiamenensis 3-C-1 TaxID=745411 RepID=K2IHA4_9GAMM|nr:DUF413 domain-containing protein [Gallaecimonas xiamenensis]EKE69496.1 hypothetical protein B3C1_15332 [Gallaecimonas xiamenensis 3-C-1]